MNSFEKFLSNLIDINGKDDVNVIQLKSILKIYTLMGVIVHGIFVICFLLERHYAVAGIEFIYFLIMFAMLKVNSKLESKHSSGIILITTLLLCTGFSNLLGGMVRYDIYIFLLIPIMIYGTYDKVWYKYIMNIGIVGIFVIQNYIYAFNEPMIQLSNTTTLAFDLLNCSLVFFSLYFYIALSKRYNETTIEKLKEDKKILDKDSKIDHLTGLYNRRSMERYLDTLEDQYHITNKPFGLILMDIDFFKKVNDTYGHQAGDKVLSEISRLIVYTLRKSDEVFRYGGEEILAVVTGVQTKDDLLSVANEIREDIQSLKIPVENQDISVTISAGITLFDGQAMDLTIKKVDEALYMAKNNGRNRVEFL